MRNEDKNPAWPDGTRVSIYHGNTLLSQQTFDAVVGSEVTKDLSVGSVNVRRGDYLTMVINGLENNAYDSGKYQFSIHSNSGLVGSNEHSIAPSYDGKPSNFASTNDGFGRQGYNGFYYQFSYNHNPSIAVNVENCENGEKYYTHDGVEIKKDYIVPGNKGKCAIVKWVAAKSGVVNVDLEYTKLLKNQTADGWGYTSLKDTGLEMKKDFVHTGAIQSPIYKWVVADDGKIDILGSYVKFGQEDSNPTYPDGITLTISKNNTQLFSKKVKVLRGDGNDNVVEFDISDLGVKTGDVISFQINPDGNNAWDAGKLNATIRVHKEPVPDDPTRTNNTSLKGSFGEQGNDGWYYGMCEWNGANFTELDYDAENNRYMNKGQRPEVKADYVEPGNGMNGAYKWVAARTGTIYVKGEYVKFANADDPNADGTCVRIFVNGEEKKWMGSNTMGNFSGERKEIIDEVYKVNAGDEIVFAVNPEGNDSYDGGRLVVNISDTKPATFSMLRTASLTEKLKSTVKKAKDTSVSRKAAKKKAAEDKKTETKSESVVTESTVKEQEETKDAENKDVSVVEPAEAEPVAEEVPAPTTDSVSAVSVIE